MREGMILKVVFGEKNVPQLPHVYWNLREELTIEDGSVLKGDLVVIPSALRPEVLNIIH